MAIPLPPWIRGANPASFAAEGLRIGDSEAAEGASQRDRLAEIALRQQQIGSEAGQASQRLQLQQQDAAASQEAQQQEIQMRQQELERQATASAQKYQAQQAYAQFIAGGGDPIQGILKFGPMMGQQTDVAAGIRAEQQQQQRMTPPSVQMQEGPDGEQIPLLVQNGRASVIPRSAYSDKAQEQWEDTTRKINGQDIAGQESKKSGRFIPYPGGDQAGAVSPQKRLQASMLTRKKASLQKTLGDDAALLALAKKKAGGKTPTHADLETVEADLQKQMDAIDQELDQIGGGSNSTPNPKNDASDSGASKTIKFKRDDSGNLVIDTANADSSGN